MPVLTQSHPGELPQQVSFIAVQPDSVALTVVKRSENSPDLIMRLYETAGKSAECTVTVGTSGSSWTGKLAPNEIKTLKVSAGAARLPIVETDMLEGLVARVEDTSREGARAAPAYEKQIESDSRQ